MSDVSIRWSVLGSSAHMIFSTPFPFTGFKNLFPFSFDLEDGNDVLSPNPNTGSLRILLACVGECTFFPLL
jgi:hypothetical protein